MLLENRDILLDDGTTLETDLVVFATGHDESINCLSAQLLEKVRPPNVHSCPDLKDEFGSAANVEITKTFPLLANPPREYVYSKGSTIQRKWDLYRRIVPPKLTDSNRHPSLVFLGQIHVGFTPVVAEAQALWAVAYLTGNLKLPPKNDMKKEAALWNAWTAKRYLEQGMRRPYALIDSLAVRMSIF